MKYQTISVNSFFCLKGAIYCVSIATVAFSHVEKSCFTWYFTGVVKANWVYYLSQLFCNVQKLAFLKSSYSLP